MEKLNKELLNNPEVREIAQEFGKMFFEQLKSQSALEVKWDLFVEKYSQKPEWEIISCEKETENTSSIKSVIRLYDGEVFSVGDKTNKGTITHFSIENSLGGIMIVIVDNIGYSIRELEKQKHPLFITEDGKEVFEGDTTYDVIGFRLQPPCKIGFNWEVDHRIHKRFSTQEFAEKYIQLNKPCLSYNDILEAMNKNKECFISSTSFEFLKQAILLTINNKNT